MKYLIPILVLAGFIWLAIYAEHHKYDLTTYGLKGSPAESGTHAKQRWTMKEKKEALVALFGDGD